MIKPTTILDASLSEWKNALIKALLRKERVDLTMLDADLEDEFLNNLAHDNGYTILAGGYDLLYFRNLEEFARIDVIQPEA